MKTYIEKLAGRYVEAAQIEVDPTIRISVEDVYRQDPEYKRFIMTVAQHLARYSGKFKLKNSELLKMFMTDIKNEL